MLRHGLQPPPLQHHRCPCVVAPATDLLLQAQHRSTSLCWHHPCAFALTAGSKSLSATILCVPVPAVDSPSVRHHPGVLRYPIVHVGPIRTWEPWGANFSNSTCSVWLKSVGFQGASREELFRRCLVEVHEKLVEKLLNEPCQLKEPLDLNAHHKFSWQLSPTHCEN